MLRRTKIKVGKLPEIPMSKVETVKPNMVDDRTQLLKNVVKLKTKRKRENV